MKDLTVGKEARQIIIFALPMILGNVFQQLYNVIDSIIVGKYIGKEALAAVGASFPIIFVLISLVIGISSGATIIISQYFGAKQFKNVKKTIDTLFIFLFFASIVISLTGIFFSRSIFEAIRLPEEVIPQAVTYFNIFVGGIIMMFGFNATSAVLRGMGDSKTPLVFLIIATILNVILDLFFVIYLKMGIEGVAIATVISQGIAFFLGVLYLNKTHTIIRFSFKNLSFDRDIFRKSIRIGLPAGLQQTFVALGMIALFRIVNDFGTNAVAAYTAAHRIDLFASMPAMNIAAALSTFVGQNIGANKISRVIRGYRATLLLTSLISVFVSIIVIIFGRDLMMLFTNDTKVIEIGRSYLVIVCAFYVVFSAMFVTNGVLRGAGDTLIPMFITLFSLWLFRIPLAYLFSRSIGTDGIWWSIPVAWASGFIFSFIYFLTGKWKNKAIIKHDKLKDILDE